MRTIKVSNVLKKLTHLNFKVKISNSEDFIVYFGRVTCPYCREFIIYMDKKLKPFESNVFYVDTEDTESNSELQKIRVGYGVKYVPTLIKISYKNTEENIQ